MSFVVSTCAHDVEWMRGSMGSHDIHLCHKMGCPDLPSGFEADATCSLVKNAGDEASSYLAFIVANYESLPENVAFVHSHQKSWHMGHMGGRNIFDFASTACAANYTSLNWLTGNRWAEERGREGQVFNRSAVHPSIAKEIQICDSVRMECCAQFIVSRAAILSRPKTVYKKLLNAVSTPRLWTKNHDHGMEYAWYTLFTGMCDMELPTAEEYHSERFSCGR